jgi:AraC-like DNA-binding protein
MENRLSIRSYSEQARAHEHNFHQLVLPLKGSIHLNISTGGHALYDGVVSSGVGVIIRSGNRHKFSANEDARFIVADLNTLPPALLQSSHSTFTTSSSMRTFLSFVEAQLEQQVNKKIEHQTVALFLSLLDQQTAEHQIEPRIERVIAWIQTNLDQELKLEEMASIAYLSATQFKKVFKQCTGFSSGQYITKLRMEKAKALIVHTDTPIGLIAEFCGYSDLSAFSRRFAAYYHQPPSFYR